MPEQTKQLKLALVGFGSSAQAFARLLIEKDGQLRREFGTEVLVTAITGKRKGTIMDESGIDLPSVLNHMESHDTFENPLPLDTFEMLKRTNADVAVELSPLSIRDGLPAIDHIKTAFAGGMHVITANKGPIAWAFRELCEIADKAGLSFLYETTVMDGAPIFNLAKYTLRGCQILSFEGILNTTTNFILAEMEKGNSFDSAVLEAQRRGFAEADPTMDISGMDSAAKTCAIINALMDGGLNPTMIETHGVEGVTARQLAEARAAGKTVKLICKGYRDERGVHGVVRPEQVPLTHPFATVEGTSSVLCLETDLMGKLSLIEHDPEIQQTAYGIYSDMLELISQLSHK